MQKTCAVCDHILMLKTFFFKSINTPFHMKKKELLLRLLQNVANDEKEGNIKVAG